MRTIKLSELTEELERFDYPIERQTIEESVADVTVQLADGEVGLATVVADLDEARFEDAGSVEESIMAALPVEAVGEPGQSEGEG